jgi:acetate kinase
MGHSTRSPDAPRAERSVLALNSGSSSIKFGLFTFEPEPRALCRGTADASSRGTAADQLLERVAAQVATYPLAGAGHRIVHGGPDFSNPQRVTPTLVASLRELVRFAPNHLPDEIDLIESLGRLRPSTPQIVCFDTAFHAGLPDVSRRLAVPARYAAEGVRRYGFHGLSYTYLLDEVRRRIGAPADSQRIVLAHLGNGSSLAAVRGGRSIDTSMGFTPIGGVVMSTRSGDLDPGVVTYIARTTGFDADQVEHELSHRAGLAALSGGTADMRELLAREADDEPCRLAVAIYCYAVRKQIGAFAAALGGLDVLVFSGGIGERAGAVRARICEDLRFLGIEIDEQRNAADGPLISTSTARVAVHVIPTDEEVVIARAAYRLLSESPAHDDRT